MCAGARGRTVAAAATRAGYKACVVKFDYSNKDAVIPDSTQARVQAADKLHDR